MNFSQGQTHPFSYQYYHRWGIPMKSTSHFLSRSIMPHKSDENQKPTLVVPTTLSVSQAKIVILQSSSLVH